MKHPTETAGSATATSPGHTDTEVWEDIHEATVNMCRRWERVCGAVNMALSENGRYPQMTNNWMGKMTTNQWMKWAPYFQTNSYGLLFTVCWWLLNAGWLSVDHCWMSINSKQQQHVLHSMLTMKMNRVLFTVCWRSSVALQYFSAIVLKASCHRCNLPVLYRFLGYPHWPMMGSPPSQSIGWRSSACRRFYVDSIRCLVAVHGLKTDVNCKAVLFEMFDDAKAHPGEQDVAEMKFG